MISAHGQGSQCAGLAIVIPVHNRLAFTRNCLELLRRQTVQAFEIIVVDDGSTDGTSELIRDKFPEVTLLHGDGDLWWTGATNLGVKTALDFGATHVMTLNDDTLPGPDFIEQMLAASALQPSALIYPSAVDADTGQLVDGGYRITWPTASSRDLLRDPKNSRLGLVEVSHCPGRGLLVPAEVFHEVGLFDIVHFPHYFADYDFAHRAGRRGHRIFVNYSVELSVYPQASGDADIRSRKSPSCYLRHLFHIKGGGNLRAFFWYAWRNCPWFVLPVCLAVGISRRLLGYVLEWFAEFGLVLLGRIGLRRRTLSAAPAPADNTRKPAGNTVAHGQANAQTP